uniref:Uncharacterized protein n=1 Tax=Tanacetum cinerariifolium TaxID=118510 RepID=A0A699HTL9_TANCI|nr:hypothetical protein [Tanacetum cinerariifolium]
MVVARGFVHLEELKVAANYTKMPDQMLVYFDRETRKEAKLANDLSQLMMELLVRVKEKKSFIEELERLRRNLLARIIPGLANIVQSVMLRKIADIREGGEDYVISTQEYVRKVIKDVSGDEDFMRGPWLSVVEFMNVDGVVHEWVFQRYQEIL